MKNFTTILLLFCTLTIFAQGEANFWYFGENAGLNFNSGSPIAISGSLNTLEGCSSFSDSNGNLLFYSDGSTVWNRLHNPMPNGTGLKGNASSSQSAMIIPKPGNSSVFYIFTVGAVVSGGGEFGFNYYTIDMNSAGGWGDVIAGPFDLSKSKSDLWTEKVAAVKGAECQTFWVISFAVNEFYAYKVSSSGVAQNPIKSIVPFTASDRRGYLKISPDGKKLAIAHMSNFSNGFSGTGSFFLYDFNAITGEVTNQKNLPLTAPADRPYGAEFSSNSEMLYVNASNDFNSNIYAESNNPANHFSTLYQFNLNSPAIADIIASRKIIDSQNLFRGGLQLGPDQKIYRALSKTYNTGIPFLGVIDNPENDGLACNYRHAAISLNGKNSTQGLPPFIASLLLPIEITSLENNNQIITNQKVKLCVGSDYTFKAEYLPGDPTYSWTYNNIEVNGTPTLTFSNIQTSDAGIYKLEVNLIDDCDFPIIYKGSFEVEVYYPPVISNSFIYDQCDIDNNTIDGITQFNLTTKIEEITQNDPNLEVLFFQTQADLDSDNPIPNSENYTSATNPNIIVKLINNLSGCFTTGKMVLNVSPTSLHSYPNYYACENDISSNNDLKSIGSGNATFDFEVKRQEIEAIFSNPSIEVAFYQNTSDAQLQINSLQGINEFPSKEIIVRISNKISKNCISAGKFDLVVNKIPIPNGSDDDIILCVSNPRDNPQLFTTYLDGKTLNPTDTYQWYFNNNIISGATNSFFEANSEGIYKVEVTHRYENNLTDLLDDSFCTGYNSFKIIESNPPAIQINDITIKDDSNNNSITISTTNLGFGEYEYSLVDYSGTVEYPYQYEPIFNNVPAGIHTILINDKKNCGTTSIDVSVIGYPKFFTPNNDGHNDTWNVLGVSENFFQSATVYIFNRFGKLVTEIDLYSNGWNGTFNGNHLPATDYWFSVELVDFKGNIRVKKGHFSLIRR